MVTEADLKYLIGLSIILARIISKKILLMGQAVSKLQKHAQLTLDNLHILEVAITTRDDLVHHPQSKSFRRWSSLNCTSRAAESLRKE